MSCLFCRIVTKELPARIVYEDENVIAFHDQFPQAPVHILIIPRKHIPTILDFDLEDTDVFRSVMTAVQQIAREFDPKGQGFRLVNNCGKAAQQTIYHIHFHFICGRKMKWPPG